MMAKVLTDKPQIYLFFILLLIILASTVDGRADSLNVEYRVKAGFLFNFFNFVSWPEGQLPTADTPLILCVVADGQTAKTISEQLEGRQVSGHNLKVIKNTSIANLSSCQMIFISAARSGLHRKILASVKDKSILTVGETRNFIADGGVINFTKENSRIRLQINQTAAAQAHLKISSKLLRVAQTVISSETGKVAR